MATMITEECINCGACEPECPNEAISEGDDLDGEVVAQKKLKVIPVRGDDDEPLDPGCVPQKNERVVYRWNGDRFAETKGAQPSPSPVPGPKEPQED